VTGDGWDCVDGVSCLQTPVNFHYRRRDLYATRHSCGIDRIYPGKKVSFALSFWFMMMQCFLQLNECVFVCACVVSCWTVCDCVAIQLLKDKPPGSFVVRNSSSFQGSFGLAVKVAQLPPNVQVKGGLYWPAVKCRCSFSTWYFQFAWLQRICVYRSVNEVWT